MKNYTKYVEWAKKNKHYLDSISDMTYVSEIKALVAKTSGCNFGGPIDKIVFITDKRDVCAITDKYQLIDIYNKTEAALYIHHIYDWIHPFAPGTPYWQQQRAAAYATLSNNALQAIKLCFGTTRFYEKEKLKEIKNLYTLTDFVFSPKEAKKGGKKQKELDEALNKTNPMLYSFTECKQIIENGAKANSYGHKKYITNTVFNKINNDQAVLRYFGPIDSSDETYLQESERLRLYISNDNVLVSKKNNLGEWIPANNTSWTINGEIGGLDYGVLLNTKLKYIAPILQQLEPKYILSFIVLWNRCPIVEQMVKNGFGLFFEEQYEGEMSYSFITKSFGSFDTKATSLTDAFGVNGWQLRLLKEYHPSGKKTNPRYYIKKWADAANISMDSIDETSFKKILSLCRTRYFDGFSDDGAMDAIICRIINLYGFSCFVDLIDDIMVLPGKLIHNKDVERMFYDFLWMVEKLDMQKDFKPRFEVDRLQSVMEMHDAVSAIYRMNSMKSSNVFSSAAQKNVSRDYSNNEYTVFTPLNAIDLGKEGINLHHCVGSYVDKVISGESRIMFLRKKSEPDKSFYTIELDNRNTIRHIAGFANCNISTNPEVIPFIKEWAKVANLHIARHVVA